MLNSRQYCEGVRVWESLCQVRAPIVTSPEEVEEISETLSEHAESAWKVKGKLGAYSAQGVLIHC